MEDTSYMKLHSNVKIEFI